MKSPARPNVVLRELARLDQLVDLAIAAGANREFRVGLTTSRLRELQDQAMNLALEDAKAQAQRLATGFGAKVGAVRSIGSSTGNYSMRLTSSAAPGFGTESAAYSSHSRFKIAKALGHFSRRWDSHSWVTSDSTTSSVPSAVARKV
jgi:hypothetical protein